VARKVPINFILLGIFTVCQAFFFCYAAAQFTPESSLMAGGMTAGMTVALTIYAMYTKTDFTVCGSLFFVISAGMLLLMLFSLFMSFATWWHPLVASILVMVYGLYLVFDIQLIAGGRSHEISLDDYVLGALLIYVDIMMIFLELLKLFGTQRK